MKCAFAMLALLLIVAAKAKASVVFTLQEIGSDVVATASGTINLADLTFNSNLSIPSRRQPVRTIFRGRSRRQH